jgi:hypothetical protein
MNFFATVFALLRDREKFLEEIHHSVRACLKSPHIVS